MEDQEIKEADLPVVIDAGSRSARPRGAVVDSGGSGNRRLSDEPENFDPSSLLHSLRRHWPLATLLGLLLGPPMAFAGWSLLVPKQSAVAYLRVDSVDAPLVFQTADKQTGRDSFGLYKSTQAQLIKTPFVLNKALADPDVKDLPVVKQQENAFQWLSGELAVGFPGKGEVMSLQLESESGQQAKQIIDAIVRAYMNEAVLDERNERLQRVDNLERVYAEAEGKVRSRRAEIRKLADTLGTGDKESLSLAQQLAIQRYAQVQSELGKVTFELMRAEGELDAYRQLAEKLDRKMNEMGVRLTSIQAGQATVKGSPDATVKNEDGTSGQTSIEDEFALTDYEKDRVLENDRTYRSLVEEERRLGENIELFKTQFGPGMVKFKVDQLERLAQTRRDREETVLNLATEEKRLRRMRQLENQIEIDPNLSPEERAVVVEQSKIIQAKEKQDKIVLAREIKVGVLAQQKQRIEQDLEMLDSEAKKLGRSSIDIEMMRAEIASLDEVLNRLGSEIERTKIELKSGSRVTVVSDATVLASSDVKKRYAATGGLGVMGFLLPFIGFIGIDLTSRRVNNSSSIARDLNVPVLGAVPRERQVGRVLLDDDFVNGRFGNSVTSIVAMLVNISRFDDIHTLMVSSAIAGEGKTTLATSLWRGLREAGHKVILVDFDLRRPSIHTNMNAKIDVGVSDVIGGKAQWQDAVRSQTDRGDYMTAGSNRGINLTAATKTGIPKLFRELREHYDFIIVDTPPILPVVDTRVIGEHVDAAVLAVMKDKSRVPQVIAANETLRAHGTPIVGVVVNGCGNKNGKYTYEYH